MGILKKIFGDYSEKQIKKIMPTVEKIESLADTFAAMSDDEMRAYTDKLRDDLKGGKTLDDILPEAFALVREAADRVLGKRPFKVQLIGGILLHQGRIAEMKTGEGKTLVATMPAYLNALTGNGVHIVTVNDYLARRDNEEMGKIHAFLGLRTGLIVHGQTPDEKLEAYNADITYATNNELGFDYLRDNRAVYKSDMVQRGLNYAIVDEVDSILIDEARTPLIISGVGEESSELYKKADSFVRTLRPRIIREVDTKLDESNYDEEVVTDEKSGKERTVTYDYIVDEKARTAVLTKYGVEKAERYFGVTDLNPADGDGENSDLNHFISNALRAHGVMKNEVEYIVKDGEVIIVDSFTGRLMPGRRYSDGLHQAIEAKEGIEIQKESRTLATITFQNFFRMYKKLSGMTGTALTEENEFNQIYALDVVVVPTNKPMIRIDRNDAIYKTRRGKLLAVVEQIKECQAKGQPVLVGTVSIDKSEELSAILKKVGIQHKVLNAKHHEREAEIVAQAGKYGAVTISTNMAGRGTDIMLGGNPEYMAKAEMRKREFTEDMISYASSVADTDNEEILEARRVYRELYDRYADEIRPEAQKVREAGGLFILGTERHESRRIDNQLRGRSGRQGDPGESKFFLSMQDDLVRLFGGDRILSLANSLGIDETTPIEMKMISSAVERAQKRIEENNFERRKSVLTYDDVMNQQRTVIYKQRSEVLLNDNIQETIVGMIHSAIDENFNKCFPTDDPESWKVEEFTAHFGGALDVKALLPDALGSHADTESIKQALIQQALDNYAAKDAAFAEIAKKVPISKDAMREVEKQILLRNVDRNWMDHLDAMDELREYIGLNSYAQRDPVAMYRIESADMFDDMIETIKDSTVRDILCYRPQVTIGRRHQVGREIQSPPPSGGNVPKRNTAKKPGRNDPCPCGSGKKYKNCCGRAANGLESLGGSQ